jgi:hypothetical protein
MSELPLKSGLPSEAALENLPGEEGIIYKV